MENTTWILIDTETTGTRDPIYPVDLAAQKMHGWNKVGPPFQRLINQNREISSEVSRIHGYTRQILEQKGQPPLVVYEEFEKYVGGRLPIVAYNLRYDWDRVLAKEWKRLGIPQIGIKGICAFRLAQRLLDPCPAGNHKLQTLRQFYGLGGGRSHTALGDVETTIELLQKVLRPRIEEEGLTSWDELERFTEKKFYPGNIPFGKYKGRDYREARTDPEFRAWIEWLAASDDRYSAMGVWYLRKIGLASPRSKSSKVEPTRAASILSTPQDSQRTRTEEGRQPQVDSRPLQEEEPTVIGQIAGVILFCVVVFLVFRGCMAILPSSPPGEPVRIKGRTYYPSANSQTSQQRVDREIAASTSGVADIQNYPLPKTAHSTPVKLQPMPFIEPAKLPTDFRVWSLRDGRQAELQVTSIDRAKMTIVFRMKDGQVGRAIRIEELVETDQLYILGSEAFKKLGN